MARSYDEYLKRGATVAGIVIDSPGQNAAMVETLALPFPVLSDPDGVGAGKPLEAWDEPGRMGKPAIILLAPDGSEAFRHVGVDFMDRPVEDDVLVALDALGLPPIEMPIATVPHLPPAPGPRALPLLDLAVYMRGVRSATQTLSKRARDPFDRSEAERTSKMAERYIAAQGATRRVIEGA